MILKTFKYQVLDSNSSTLKVLNNQKISLEIAENAKSVLHHTLKILQKNKYKSLSSTKTRSEVSGSGRKPWKQKGTGRARAGSNRSPLWRGGGVIFGPRTKNKTLKKLNKKEKKLAIKTAIYNKQQKICVLNTLELTTTKQKGFIEKLSKINFNLTKKDLIIVLRGNKTVQKQNSLWGKRIINHARLQDIVKSEKILIDENSLKILIGIPHETR
jgi:large subunit ribosomal protein L4